MKKSNLVTFLSLCLLIAGVILFMYFGAVPASGSDEGAVGNPGQSELITMPPSVTDDSLPEDGDFSYESGSKAEKDAECGNEEPDNDANEQNVTEGENSESESVAAGEEPTGNGNNELNTHTTSMEDALFIGDSRTVGLSEYSILEGADFFANVGMNVYNVNEKTVSVPTVGKVTLDELLNYKTYDKIYVMLGINELGYNRENTVAKYADLIDYIQEKQPDAIIIIEANLHVTKSRSDSDKVINNNAINEFNSAISGLADGKKIFYFDVNVLFDDENGSLPAEKSQDSAHLYAKYYIEWGEWIIRQTVALIGEG